MHRSYAGASRSNGQDAMGFSSAAPSFIVQCRDLSEGNGALWYDLKRAPFATRELARGWARKLRDAADPEDLLTFRVVEYGTPEYYSQPTDRLEW